MYNRKFVLCSGPSASAESANRCNWLTSRNRPTRHGCSAVHALIRLRSLGLQKLC